MNMLSEPGLDAGVSVPWHARPLRILVAHNAYQWRGGEDNVRDAEIKLLRDGGHTVETLDRDNADIGSMSKVATLRETLWSTRTTADVRACIETFRPDVIHVQNSFPLVSPSLYWEANRRGVPVVQTLHNFRLLCPQAMFLHKDQVCEDCLGKVPWRGVVRRCYRDSAAQTAVVATMLSAHRMIGTYTNKVSQYVALNAFCREKFIEGGLPADRIVIKPNFVDVAAHEETTRSGGLFVGRLSREKGIQVLLEALRKQPGLGIDVIGEGPMQADIATHAKARSLGSRAKPDVLAAMRRAAWLVLPSVWHEVMPLTVLEAFACGLPVIGSRSGALAELIQDGRTGLLFEQGNAVELARVMAWAEANPERMREMGANARAEYAQKYTPERNLAQLLDIYAGVLPKTQPVDVPVLPADVKRGSVINIFAARSGAVAKMVQGESDSPGSPPTASACESHSHVAVAPLLIAPEMIRPRADTAIAVSRAFSVFHEPWWLDIATDGNWRMATVNCGTAIAGEMPYALHRKAFLKLSQMPPLTRTLGPVLKPYTPEHHQTALTPLEIMNGLAQQIPRIDSFYQIFDPRVSDALAFGLNGFSISARYTFQFDAGADIADLWKGLRGKTRNVIRTAGKLFRIAVIESPEEFHRFYERNLERRSRENVYGSRVMQRLVDAFVARGAGYLLGAYEPSGKLVAAIGVVCDQSRACYLLSTRTLDVHSGTISLLVWAAVQDAMQRNLVFDFDGIPNASTYRFLSGFNATLKQRLAVERSTAVCSVARALRRATLSKGQGPFVPTI